MKAPSILRRLALALAVTLGAGATVAQAQTPTSTTPHCAWYGGQSGQISGAIQLATDTNTITHAIALKNLGSLAMNGSDCGVWALTDKQVYKFDANAAHVWSLPLTALGPLQKVSLTVVNPFDNSLWLSDDKSLVQLDSTGQLQLTMALPESMNGIVLALDHSFWALGKKTLWHLGAQGQVLSSQALPSTMGSPKVMAIDDLNGVLWLAKDKRLAPLKLNPTNGTPLSLTLPDNVLSLAVNPLTGTLWILTEKKLLSYGADGQAGAVVDQKALGLKDVLSIGVDPVTQTVLVSTQTSLVQFSVQGNAITPLSTLPSKNNSGSFAAPAFLLAPTVSLVRPPALTNNPTPPISYAYGALCNGQPCGFGPESYRNYSLAATLNQAAIGPFVFEVGTGQTSLTPTNRLTEGANTLVAQATDGFGHRSPVMTDSFILDTIPPKFLTLTPAEGSLTNIAAATILGKVDDNQANVILNHAERATTAAKTPDSSGSFSFPVTLKEGVNTFDLTAWDRANNSGKTTLHLTLDSTPPAFLNVMPTTGTTLTNAQVTVSGSVDDPAATVTLTNPGQWNATGANPSGQNFSWNLTLKPGDNSLQLTATDRAGNSAAYALTLTYIPPPPPVPVTGKITQGTVINGTVSIIGASGAVTPGLAVDVMNTRSQETVTVLADATGGFAVMLPVQGGDVLSLRVKDAWGQSSPVLPFTVKAEASLYFIHSDHLNTPRLVTDGNNGVVWRNLPTTEPFGADAPEEDPNGTGRTFELPLGLPGQYRDKETGLSYNFYRDGYNPATGSYTQSDPIGLAGGSLSIYTYVGGNPVNSIDPLGLRCNGNGCWLTPEEAKLANSGDYKGYYAAACAAGDSYACMAGKVASNEGLLANITNRRLENSLKDNGATPEQCPDKMENIRKALAKAHAGALSNGSEHDPIVLTKKQVSDFHNKIFSENGAGRVFGGDIPVFGNWPFTWCSAPSCQP